MYRLLGTNLIFQLSGYYFEKYLRINYNVNINEPIFI